MGFLDKAKQAAEQAKTAAEQAANRANETVADVQTKRELTKAYADLGETTFRLADAGAISHPEIEGDVARIRELRAKIDEPSPASEETPATETVEQPLSGAGPGAA